MSLLIPISSYVPNALLPPGQVWFLLHLQALQTINPTQDLPSFSTGPFTPTVPVRSLYSGTHVFGSLLPSTFLHPVIDLGPHVPSGSCSTGEPSRQPTGTYQLTTPKWRRPRPGRTSEVPPLVGRCSFILQRRELLGSRTEVYKDKRNKTPPSSLCPNPIRTGHWRPNSSHLSWSERDIPLCETLSVNPFPVPTTKLLTRQTSSSSSFPLLPVSLKPFVGKFWDTQGIDHVTLQTLRSLSPTIGRTEKRRRKRRMKEGN